MSDLHLSPDFEAALRAGLAELAATAPVPEAAHLDALEARAGRPAGPAPRNGRPLVLVAAIVLVIAAVVSAVILRGGGSDDRPAGPAPTSTTTVLPTTVSSLLVPTTAVGPVIPARKLSSETTAVVAGDPEGVITLNSASDQATLAEVWDLAGVAVDHRPAVDLSEEVVIEIIADDHGCPSTEVDFQRGPAAVRAQVVEPATCGAPLDTPVRRAFVYALPWSETGRPFSLDVYLPEDLSGFGSIPVD